MATRRSISVTLVLALAGVLLLLQSSFVAAKGGPTILEWQTMVGVPQAFTGTTNQAVIRGVPGGGIPWRLDLGKGELSRNGHLEIKVRGLVLATGDNAGTQPGRRVPRARQLPDRPMRPDVVNVPTGERSRPAPGRRAPAAATPTSRPTSTCRTRASHRSSS